MAMTMGPAFCAWMERVEKEQLLEDAVAYALITPERAAEIRKAEGLPDPIVWNAP